MLHADLAKTLESVAAALNSRRRDWVVFGGSAMALYGFDVGEVKDIDIIVSSETAASLMSELCLKNQADGGSARFRSEYLLRPDFGPVEVEILGNFEIKSAMIWHRVALGKPNAICVGNQTVFVAEVAALADIFDLCARPKDLARSQLIRSREDGKEPWAP